MGNSEMFPCYLECEGGFEFRASNFEFLIFVLGQSSNLVKGVKVEGKGCLGVVKKPIPLTPFPFPKGRENSSFDLPGLGLDFGTDSLLCWQDTNDLEYFSRVANALVEWRQKVKGVRVKGR